MLLAINDILISLQKTKKKMESTRDQLAEALYQKGLALAEVESLKVDILYLILINVCSC
jgi:site-specific recombinase XerC